MRSGARAGALMLLGVLLAQAAWVLAVPPFRGMDEFDHAFRAAGVASGQWRLSEPAEGGRGLLVEVPAQLVAASQGQCESLPYIESETCDGDGPGANGTVLATTSAAHYVPIYYWVVGSAGESFSGAHSLYAMRAASALLCAVVVAIGVLCMTTWVRGPWAFVGLLVGLSPTLIYTTTVVAPNGLEMAAGMCLWGALLGLGTGVVDVRRERRLLSAAALGVVLLAGLRGLGPLLVLLILVSVVALRGVRPLLGVAGRHRSAVGLVVGLAVATRAAVFAWNRGNVVIPPGALNGDVDATWTQVLRWPNWILGSIGAFPYRDQPAPLVVHLLVLLVLVTLLVAAVRHGDPSARRAVLVSALLCLAVPSVLVAVTLEERGGIWQGRYLLPFMVGVTVLAGLALDHARWRIERRDRGLRLLAVAMLAMAHVVSVAHVQLSELDRNVSAQDPGWGHPPVAVTAALALAGWAVLGTVALRFRSGRAVVHAEPPATAESNAP